MSYFAVSTQGDSDRYLIRHLIETATSIGFMFKGLEVFDKFNLGSTEFLRFNINKDVTLLLDALFKEGRSVIGSSSGGFMVRMPTRIAEVPISLMQVAPRRRSRYRGNKDPYWGRQFE
jgi:hypothetical protein